MALAPGGVNWLFVLVFSACFFCFEVWDYYMQALRTRQSKRLLRRARGEEGVGSRKDGLVMYETVGASVDGLCRQQCILQHAFTLGVDPVW